jgi:hypothetical protein
MSIGRERPSPALAATVRTVRESGAFPPTARIGQRLTTSAPVVCVLRIGNADLRN